MSLNHFDVICYINLEHRLDRKIFLLEQLDKFEVKKEKIVRIPACQDFLNGYKGGALSHIKALDYAITNNLNNVLILEDDCLFTKTKIITDKLITYFLKNITSWDVFLLGGQFFKKRKTKYPHILKILKSFDAHAYVVNKHYFKILKQCFLESYNLTKNQIFYTQSQITKNIFDVYWNNYQKKDNWYSLETQIAIQNDSYSDNEKKERLYKNIKL